MENNYNIIVLDLDGTLTDSKKELSERNRKALIAAQQQGACIVLASGRPTYGIVPIAQALELDKFGGYILSFNGGMIIEYATGKIIYQNSLPEELIKPLYEESKAAGCTILSYDGDVIFAEESAEKNKYVAHEAFLNKMQVRECQSFTEQVKEPLTKCLSVGDPELVIELEKHLLSLYGSKMSIYRSEPFFLELVPLGIDKAQSLEKLLQYTGGSKDEMVAFGDGFNDLSMIEYAGCGVAMANAQNVLLERANQTTLSNDEDGVAVWVEENILKGL
ncbi:MAG: Cof-type HAD-IIB family hydrolase [Rikenellaceae bacterium]